MNIGRTFFPYGEKVVVMGGGVWLWLLFRTIQTSRLSIFELLFLLGVLVVVPLALNLIPATGDSWPTQAVCKVVLYCLFSAAFLTIASLLHPVGRIACAAATPWLLIGVFLAIDGLARLIRTRFRSFQEFCFAFGEGYALVGAIWFLESRLGLQPFGFHEPIVLLTAIHFHYAGLMAAVLAGLVASTIRTPVFLRVALGCAVLGPGLLGLAFLIGPELKLAAVGLMVIGEFGIAAGTFRIGLANAATIGGRLLLVGSACVLFGMVLAAVWAVGEYLLHAFVNLEQMARYHGVLNSVGFGLSSLIGWTLLRRNPHSGAIASAS